MDSQHQSRYLIKPNSLRKLAGKPDQVELVEHLSNGNFSLAEDGVLSVEIITLSQHRYELAFEKVANSTDFSNLDMDDMSDRIDNIVDNYKNVQPHIQVHSGEITVVVDCVKIDTKIVEYASKLLTQIPCLDVGFYWEYLKTEK